MYTFSFGFGYAYCCFYSTQKDGYKLDAFVNLIQSHQLTLPVNGYYYLNSTAHGQLSYVTWRTAGNGVFLAYWSEKDVGYQFLKVEDSRFTQYFDDVYQIF